MDNNTKHLLTFVSLLVLMIIYFCIIAYVTVWAAAMNWGYYTNAVPVIMLLPIIIFALRLDNKRRKEALEPKLKSGEWTPVQNMEKTVGEYLSMSDEEEKKDEEQ